MRNTVFVSVVALLAAAAFAGAGQLQPLNVKPGMWQVTETYSATGLPAGLAGHTFTYKSCVTEKDLASNPFRNGDQDCTWTVLNSTGSDMEMKGTSCPLARDMGMDSSVHFKLHVVDPEHVTGSGDWTASGNGQQMNGKATGSGKRISATCSSD